jgi:hypothetical protein
VRCTTGTDLRAFHNDRSAPSRSECSSSVSAGQSGTAPASSPSTASHHQHLVRGAAAASLRILHCIIRKATALTRQCSGAPRGKRCMALDAGTWHAAEHGDAHRLSAVRKHARSLGYLPATQNEPTDERGRYTAWLRLGGIAMSRSKSCAWYSMPVDPARRQPGHRQSVQHGRETRRRFLSVCRETRRRPQVIDAHG